MVYTWAGAPRPLKDALAQSLPYPLAPEALRRGRGPFWRWLGGAYLRLGGWQVEGPFPEVPQVVAIVAPHTSNWDFPLGLALMFAADLRVSWLGKHSLFRWPFGALLRRLGGIPVDRRANHGVVGDCVKAFEASRALLLCLAPEGTRRSQGQWRSGFYQIARGAGVPILPVAFDFGRHVIRLMPLVRPSGTQAQDLPLIQALFSDIRGRLARPS